MTKKNDVTFSSRPTHASKHAHAQARQMFSEYDTSSIRPKKSKLPVVFAALIAVVVVLLVVFLVIKLVGNSQEQASALSADQQATITVVSGDSVSTIANELQRAGLITDTSGFIKAVQDSGAESLLQAGTYTFNGQTPVDEIIATMKAGSGLEGAKLTIPEGYTLAQIAAQVETVTSGRITAEAFTQAAQAKRWTNEFSFTSFAGDNSLEGMLFPATYGITDTMTVDDVVRMMLQKFSDETSDLDISVATNAGLSWYQWLTLASIVQAESTAGDEATVASVFYNRIAQGMPLQSDATSAYSVGGLPSVDDLNNYDDPYNTYSYDRLGVDIPTPIGNPGLASLEAAAQPADTDYLYFYAMEDASGDMHTYFSATYEEHQGLIEQDK